jgi:gamma-glutamyltranspeptidase/glutathione hydrolase
MSPIPLACVLAVATPLWLEAGSAPFRARSGMVVSQNIVASQVGFEVLESGGNAVDAAVAAAFALAVVHPEAGNIGGGGFMLVRPAQEPASAYDFREMAPAEATPTLFLQDGRYSHERHHERHTSVGVPGTVAGLYAAWSAYGRLPWRALLAPAIALAREGFPVSNALERSLREALPSMKRYPASIAQFSRGGIPYEEGEPLKQPDLAKTLERIADRGVRGFYEGETAELIVREMQAGGGLITLEDLRAYKAYRRAPLVGRYRGYELLAVPPPSSGGVVVLQALNVLEGLELPAMGFGSARYVHHVVEALRRAFADRARHLGDPGVVKDMPVERLVSKEYAADLRKTIRQDRASTSSPGSFEWPAEPEQTTHLSVVDGERNAVALTVTLEDRFGSKIVVPGAGFLLNNEMGDFNAGPGLTDASGLIGTPPNLAGPRKRMLSSMAPTIVARPAEPTRPRGEPYLVVGSPGGRTIPSTVLQVILNVVDFGMNVQEAVDAARFHHQWLPDEIRFERHGLSPDTIQALEARGHRLAEVERQGVVQAIQIEASGLEGGSDRRTPDGGAVGR